MASFPRNPATFSPVLYEQIRETTEAEAAVNRFCQAAEISRAGYSRFSSDPHAQKPTWNYAAKFKALRAGGSTARIIERKPTRCTVEGCPNGACIVGMVLQQS